MKVEHIIIITLLVVILILIICFMCISFTTKLEVKTPLAIKYDKANAFIQDLCTQINEKHYTVLFDRKSRVEGSTIYISAHDEKKIYEEIIELLSHELHKKSNSKREEVKRALEQVAYNLGYLVCTVNCSK